MFECTCTQIGKREKKDKSFYSESQGKRVQEREREKEEIELRVVRLGEVKRRGGELVRVILHSLIC